MRKKLALSAVSILITLLFAEIALRILGIGAIGRGSAWFAGGNHPRFLFQADPVGYTLRPGFQGREIAQSKEFDVPVAIDGQGLRAQPHTAPPQPRVLAIGDSMTFGEGVPADATWPAALERTLGGRGRRAHRAQPPGGPAAGEPIRGRLPGGDDRRPGSGVRARPRPPPSPAPAARGPLGGRGRPPPPRGLAPAPLPRRHPLERGGPPGRGPGADAADPAAPGGAPPRG